MAIVSALVRPLSTLAFNPLFTACLLWALTQGPAPFRQRALTTVARGDEGRLAMLVKALRWLLAAGLMGTANQVLNKLALNAWRARSDKRWQWDQEVAVVTGGCGALGAAMAKGLARRGTRVAVLDVHPLPPSLQDHANIRFFACDITDPDAVYATAAAVRAALGLPSVLVNNAGISAARTILGTSDADAQKMVAVNLTSHWTTVKAFLPDMIAKNKGHVVTIASLASFACLGGAVDYCAAKAGAMAFHEGLVQELKHGYDAPQVLTTLVQPGWISTPLIKTYEPVLRANGVPLLDAKAVADQIVDQIFRCRGAQLVIAPNAGRAAALRALPNWIQELGRGRPSKVLLQAIKDSDKQANRR